MEFGLSGLRTTDFGRKGQDLVLVFVNILRFLLYSFPIHIKYIAWINPSKAKREVLF